MILPWPGTVRLRQAPSRGDGLWACGGIAPGQPPWSQGIGRHVGVCRWGAALRFMWDANVCGNVLNELVNWSLGGG